MKKGDRRKQNKARNKAPRARFGGHDTRKKRQRNKRLTASTCPDRRHGLTLAQIVALPSHERLPLLPILLVSESRPNAICELFLCQHDPGYVTVVYGTGSHTERINHPLHTVHFAGADAA